MCAERIADLFHFMGIEKNNELSQMANLGDNFFLIQNLDVLYRKCLDLKPIDDEKLKIPSFLYLVVHNEYYHSMTAFLRMHQSKSFVNLRVSIDCALAAYYLLRNPDKINIYLNKEDPDWNKIFFSIKHTIKSNIDDFPLAKTLPEIHGFCSTYAHSDYSGIAHRLRIDKEKLRLEATYFDYEENHDEYNKKLSWLIIGYFIIFKIFWEEMYILRAGEKTEEIKYFINEFLIKFKEYYNKYPPSDNI